MFLRWDFFRFYLDTKARLTLMTKATCRVVFMLWVCQDMGGMMRTRCQRCLARPSHQPTAVANAQYSAALDSGANAVGPVAIAFGKSAYAGLPGESDAIAVSGR